MTMSSYNFYAEDWDAKLKNGGMIGVKSGWINPLTKNIMALEFEYNYIFGTDFDNSRVVNEINATLDGTIRIHAFLFNIKARYPNGPVHPYVGIGLGYSFFQVGEVTIRDTESPYAEVMSGTSGGGFTYQFVGGVDFDITPNLSLGMGYKYFVATPSLNGEGTNLNYDLDYRASIINAGLTFTF
jgi:opacity protein-like surface antigen